MSALFRAFTTSITRLHIDDEDDFESGGINVLYPLTLFFAFGIWLVFQRYQTIRNRAAPFYWPAPKAADPQWQSLLISNPNLESHLANPDLLPPDHTPGRGRRYITSYDPATSLFIGAIVADDSDSISSKIEKAQSAQKTWRETTCTQRKKLLRSLLKWLVDNREVCAKVACRDTGKTMIDAALGEILTTCSKIEWILNHGERILKPEKRHNNFLLSYKRSEVRYEPLGVVAAIVSWNYPLHNAWSPIVASLFTGNGIVVKCSEHVVWSSSWFVGAVRECLRTCGHDPELVQIVSCWPEDAEALTTSPLVKHITFIGSEEIGRKVAIAAAKHLTPVTLELGGKDPAIILPGTDIRKWLSLWMRGVFQNAGQNCIGIERLIVHSSQHDELLEELGKRAETLRLGSVLYSADGYISPVDCGSMISSDRFSTLRTLILDAVHEGASLVHGGGQYKHVYLDNGSYFMPTVIGDVLPSMAIAQTELFAPVATLMKYHTVEEAIDIANGTKYGLGASVFGPDQHECIDVAKQLECGMVAVNDFGVFYLNQDLPFGGVKGSGYGRFGGPEGLRALTNPKAIIVDRWPAFIQTGIPSVLDYPVRSLVASWDFVSGLVAFMYANTWYERLRGLSGLISASRR